MKIRTKLQLLFIFLLLSFAGLVIIFQYSFNKSQAESNKHETLMGIKDNIYSLGLSLYEYSINHDLEIRYKWNSVHGKILDDIRRLVIIDSGVQFLHDSYIELDSLFEQLLKIEEQELYSVDMVGKEELKKIDYLEESIFNQILTKSELLFREASLLTESSHDQISVINNRNRFFILSFVVVVGLMLLLFLYFISRDISKSLYKLMTGIKVVGSGDLNCVIEVVNKDEIGQITNSFNNMTKQLHESRLNIEKEVYTRTQELEKINDYMVGREMKMIELKKEINNLKKK